MNDMNIMYTQKTMRVSALIITATATKDKPLSSEHLNKYDRLLIGTLEIIPHAN